MPSIGPLELIIVLSIALVILGPKRLPDAGRSLGRGMREFKHAITTGGDRDDDEPHTPSRSAGGAVASPGPASAGDRRSGG